MARVARMAGALLLETGGDYFLVGNTKEPCDFRAAGFEPPSEIDAVRRPFLPLRARGTITLLPPWLSIGVEGESAAELIANRLLIARNGSVSDRLWRLIIRPDAQQDAPEDADVESVEARWLVEMPGPVWEIVRETVLRCL
jgi:hypothetical protein